MLSSLLLSFREGFEASLIIAIILVYLYQASRRDLVKYVYSGTALGITVSLVGGFFGFKEAEALGGSSEKMFQGVMMLAAAVLIAYFVVWMGNQNNNQSSDIKEKVKNSSSGVGLFILSFLSVFREGMELVIFTLTKVGQKASNVAIGSAIGIVLAVVLTYIIFKSSIKINLKLIFKILGFILIYIGAEMFAEGILMFITLKAETAELILLIIYLIPALYVFLKNDIKKLTKRSNR